MTIITLASLQSKFEDGDKPTGSDFEDMFDTLTSDNLNGFILNPQARLYQLEQRARVPFTVDWIAVNSSAGHCRVTLLADTSIITGFSSAAVDITEVEASASSGSGNTIDIGETLNIRVSDVSSPDALAFTIGITRT